MIEPAKCELRAYRNGDLRQRVTLTADGGLLDMTGWTARLQVRKQEGALGIPYVDINSTAATANGSVITFPELGAIEFFVNHRDWTKVPILVGQSQTLAFDLVLTQPAGDTEPYVVGTITFREGVTVS